MALSGASGSGPRGVRRGRIAGAGAGCGSAAGRADGAGVGHRAEATSGRLRRRGRCDGGCAIGRGGDRVPHRSAAVAAAGGSVGLSGSAGGTRRAPTARARPWLPASRRLRLGRVTAGRPVTADAACVSRLARRGRIADMQRSPRPAASTRPVRRCRAPQRRVHVGRSSAAAEPRHHAGDRRHALGSTGAVAAGVRSAGAVSGSAAADLQHRIDAVLQLIEQRRDVERMRRQRRGIGLDRAPAAARSWPARWSAPSRRARRAGDRA